MPAAAGRYLPAAAERTWSGEGISVAASGLDSSVAVSDDLVVAVAGRVNRIGHDAPGATGALDAAAVMLERYRRRGRECLVGLDDDLVAAIVERRTRRVVVVRDLGGTLPMYVTTDGDALVASTSLDAVVGAVGRLTVDERWAAALLDGSWAAAGVSPYEEVTSLPPGFTAAGTGAGWSTSQLDRHVFATDVPRGPQASAHRFRTLFDDGVRRRIASVDGPVAVTLSGGLDSSSVLVSARAVAPQHDLVALALGFTDRRGDERTHQRVVADAARARLIWVDPHALEGPFGGGPEQLFARFGAPPVAGNWFLHEGMLSAAREARVLRVLDGEDGDGVVGVRPVYLADVLARRGLVALLQEARTAADGRGASTARYLRRAGLGAWRSLRRGTWGFAEEAAARTLVHGGYLSALTAQAHGQWQPLPGGVSHPFLDRQVVSYALAVPLEHKVRAGVSKMLLRESMVDRLPASVLGRTDKALLSNPFVTTLRGSQWQVLQDGLSLARRNSPDIRGVPVVDRADASAFQLYTAYRFAVVALWRDWVTHGHNGSKRRL